MASLGDLVIRVGAEISNFQDAMKQVQDELGAMAGKATGAADEMESGFSKMFNGIVEHSEKVKEQFEAVASAALRLQIVGAELTEAITNPLKELAEDAVKAAASTEHLAIVYGALLGSSKEGSAFVEELHAFAATSPISMASIDQGAQRMLAFGFATKDVIPLLKTVGDVSTAFGRGNEGVETLVGLLGKIRSMGSISGRNLLALNKFGGTSAIAAGLGISNQEVTAMAKKKPEEGGLDDVKGINALMAGWNSKFGGVAQDQMGGLTGQMANLKNQIELTMDAIGTMLLPVATKLTEWAREAQVHIRELVQWFSSLPTPVKDAAAAFLATIAAIGPLIVLVAGVVLGFASLVGAFAAIPAAAAAVGVSVGTLLGTGALFAGWAVVAVAAFAAVVGALAALGVWVNSHWAGVVAAVTTAWDGLKEIWQATIAAPFEALVAMFSVGGDGIIGIWKTITGALIQEWDIIRIAATTFWQYLKQNVIDPMMAALEKIPGVMKLLSVGTAFHKADDADQAHQATQKEHDDAVKDAGIGKGDPFKMTTDKADWMEHHQKRLKALTEDVNNYREALAKGIGTEKELAQVQNALDEERKKKYEDTHAVTAKTGKDKLDRNALAAISGENAHEQAMLALNRGAVSHEYESAQLSSTQKAAMSPQEIADAEIQAAARRRQELVAIAGDELKDSLKMLDQKLALYKGDQTGYQALVNDKKTAQDKYVAEVQKAGFQEADVRKRAEDQIEADTLRRHDQELKEEKRHVDAMAQVRSVISEANTRHLDALASMRDKQLAYELETGELSKTQYLKLKQEALDEAYRREVAHMQEERDLLDAEYDALLSNPNNTPQQQKRLMDDYSGKSARLDVKRQQTDDKHAAGTQDLDIQKNQQQYNTFFKPIETSFASGMKGLIEGTKTFKQAWADMSKSILDNWITSLTQMAAKWVVHKLAELALHIGVNQAKVASDGAAAAESNSISLTQHLREIARAAAQAAAKTWAAVSGIPIVGPILAPIAAAAAFAGVLALGAVSAEHGGVMPNADTIAFLHPREMVLPSHLSTGLQRMISGGMVPSAGQMHGFSPSGAPNAQTAAMLGAAASGGDTNHHWGGVQITVHNSANDRLTPDGIYGMMQQAVRGRNLKMA